ncbi:MAG: hypothetical protein ACLURV_14265 [Gallintestinimicrobium sp.]
MYECTEGSAAAGDKDGMGTTLYPSLYGDRTLFLLAGIAFDQKITTPVRRGWRVTQKVGLQEWQSRFPCHARDV